GGGRGGAGGPGRGPRAEPGHGVGGRHPGVVGAGGVEVGGFFFLGGGVGGGDVGMGRDHGFGKEGLGRQYGSRHPHRGPRGRLVARFIGRVFRLGLRRGVTDQGGRTRREGGGPAFRRPLPGLVGTALRGGGGGGGRGDGRWGGILPARHSRDAGTGGVSRRLGVGVVVPPTPVRRIGVGLRVTVVVVAVAVRVVPARAGDRPEARSVPREGAAGGVSRPLLGVSDSGPAQQRQGTEQRRS